MIEKPFNLKVIDTKQEIISKLSQFPIAVSQMIINEVKQIVDANVNIITAEERQKYNESLNKKDK